MITSRCATEFVTRTITVIHEIIHSSSAVLRKDETYGFVYFKANSSFEAFRKDAQQTMDTFHQPQAAELDTDNRDDTMHGSSCRGWILRVLNMPRVWWDRQAFPSLSLAKSCPSTRATSNRLLCTCIMD